MHAPDLTMHFEKEQMDATMFATNWFMTLFTDYKLLSQKCVLTIFDMFVMDGWPVSCSPFPFRSCVSNGLPNCNNSVSSSINIVVILLFKSGNI